MEQHQWIQITNSHKKINTKYPIKFIGINDLNRKILTKIFPFSNDSKIDITAYDIQSLKVINTLDSRINIICNKELPSNYGYNLVKNIFSNRSTIIGGYFGADFPCHDSYLDVI